nr:retrovirus-related Pol polyprotein from transposon TNT 1-94 [Tanacetum cinerariifolium]
MSCLPDDIMESVISYETAKATWTDLVHSFEGLSDTKENKIMDLKLEYQTFRAKPTKSLSRTYTRYKTLLNELSNDGVNFSKHEINVGFVNSLLEKWLTFSRRLRNANHTQTLDLADIYRRFFYEDNLIQRRYSDSKKALITTPSSTAISTAFFSNNVIQDFQENSDDKSPVTGYSLVSKGFQPKFTPKLIQSSQTSISQADLKVQKDYKAEYKKMKTKLALLEPNQGTDDELTVGKNHARNGEWIDITMRKVNILLSMDEDVDWQNYLKYINIDLKRKAQRRLELKARSTLLMGIPDEHQLKFNSIKDSKSFLQAVEKRFGGNAATKKTQRNLLKQQYENFTASSLEVNITMNGDETIGFDKSKVKCYNCHKRGHFARECRDPRNQENKNSCSSSCLENVKILKEQNEQLIKDLRTSKIHVITYKTGLESVEARLLVYKKIEFVYEEDIKLLKLENFENSSKNLSKLLDCQILDKCKTGLGYNVVPPPYTGNFLPPKPDLYGLEEFVNEPIVSEPTVKKLVVKTNEAKASADTPKDVRKNFGSPIIEDWISDSEDQDESKPKIEKKTVKPSFAKIEFVKSKEQVKSPRKTVVKQG